MALEEPMVFFGILALASRYEHFRSQDPENLESTHYHNECLELLIAALSNPPDTYGVVLLTTVVLTRLYEEYNADFDTYFYHLTGTETILSCAEIARSAPEGGMAEAASWIHLCQSIYISLVHERHLEIDLDLYDSFKSLQSLSHHDSSVAKRSILNLARIVKATFPHASPQSVEDTDLMLAEFDKRLNEWQDNLPPFFCPVHEVLPDIEAGRPFPIIWMFSTMQGTE
ncbi:hypothetical protein ACHAPJ_010436 [Fusarium lateritium]